jgi:multidrug efflux pump subunit AcrA (membrane-fusion protein)
MQVIPVDLYEDLENLDPQTKKVIVKLIKYMGEIVRREDFLELKEETNKLAKTLAELAEAQKRTEERLNELTEAQKRTEERLNQLAEKVESLAEAQRRTDQRLAELAEAQRRTEQKVAELAEAQRRTEEELRKLILDHRKTREQLGGLSHTFGYFLENEAYKYLPKLLQRDFGLEIEGRLLRDHIEIAPNRYEEINIYGKGKIQGKPIIILGEAKTQLKKADIDNFLKKVDRLQKILPEDKIFILVTHQTSPQIKNYAQSKGLKIYFSYEFI